MIPEENIQLVIYRGVRSGATLEFIDDETGEPYDLTDHAPFRAEVRHVSRGDLIAAFITSDEGYSEGKVGLALEADVTALLDTATHQWGMIDADGNPWVNNSPCIVKGSIPEVES